jgi:hypothetical protein
MTVEIIRVDPREMGVYAEAMGLAPDAVQACVLGAKGADPALAFVVQGQPVAACGFVPTAVLSGTVYAWMQDTPAMYHHTFALKRVWREVFAEVRRHYPRIVGHCSAGPRSERWLRRLGARFTVDDRGVPTYMIGG